MPSLSSQQISRRRATTMSSKRCGVISPPRVSMSPWSRCGPNWRELPRKPGSSSLSGDDRRRPGPDQATKKG